MILTTDQFHEKMWEFQSPDFDGDGDKLFELWLNHEVPYYENGEELLNYYKSLFDDD